MRWPSTTGRAASGPTPWRSAPIANARYDDLLAEHPEVGEQMRELHPLGRVGRGEEVAAVVAHLLSPDAGYVNGAIVPVDGGRSVLGLDPEAR